MPPTNPRHAARAVILDADDRILLLRMDIPEPRPVTVWVAPGGGVEAGESAPAALRRELLEETGLEPVGELPHVWRQEVGDTDVAPGHDGIVNDYFLVRADAFTPRGTFSDARIAAEHIRGHRWWSLAEIAEYTGPQLFSPRDLVTPLAVLLAHGPPQRPVRLGE